MKICKCGHPRSVHEHWRDGTDCGQCGKVACSKYRRRWFRWS